MQNFIRSALFTCLWLIASTASWADDGLLGEAREHLKGGDPQAAYELLAPLNDEWAGDPEFDYLLGLAALDTGNYTEAIFALERVVLVKPDHTQARAELARAHFLAGERDAAKKEFDEATRQSPPPEVQSTIDRYLAALEQRRPTAKTDVRGFLSLTLGHDSNVNAATSDTTIAIPGFTGLWDLDPSGVEQQDTFAELSGGVSVTHPLSDRVAAIGALRLRNRINDDAGAFETTSLNGHVGLRWQKDKKNTFTAGVQAERFNVGHDRYRDTRGLVGQWRHAPDKLQQFSIYTQLTRLDIDTSPRRDAERRILGAGYSRAFDGRFSPVGFVGAYGGKHDNRRTGADDVAYDVYGLRAGGQLEFTQKWKGFAAASTERRNYDGADSVFGLVRNDRQYNISVGATYTPARNWGITPQVAYTRNKSNIVINDYDRTIVSVSLRRDFD